MLLTKIGPKHQVTIPKEVFEALNLEVGDYLEAEVQRTKIILTPKRMVAKAPTAPLSPKEQRLLKRAKAKMARIQQDLLRAKGLTVEEAKIAAKAGLIAPEQAYWWTEDWQKGERAAEADLRAGRVKKFERVEDLLADLRS